MWRETLLWGSRGSKRRRRGLKAYMKIKGHKWEKNGEARKIHAIYNLLYLFGKQCMNSPYNFWFFFPLSFPLLFSFSTFNWYYCLLFLAFQLSCLSPSADSSEGCLFHGCKLNFPDLECSHLTCLYLLCLPTLETILGNIEFLLSDRTG